MAILKCEMCGSTDLIKQDGVFVCQSCECKYSVEEAKKMMVEGTVKIDTSAELQRLLKRAFMFLEDGEWDSANEYCEKVLDIDPENEQAYLGKLMVNYRVCKPELLARVRGSFENNKNYAKILRFGSDEIKRELESYLSEVKKRLIEYEANNKNNVSDKASPSSPPAPTKLTAIPHGITKITKEILERGITELTIPDSVTIIDERAFEGCTKLREIFIPDSVTTIGEDAFNDCKSLAYITIPNSVTNLGKGVFHGCTALTHITILNGITEIGNYEFMGLKKLIKIVIPENVTTIGKSAFEDCENLKDISLPNGVTTIGDRAFKGCVSLDSITIPESVKKIGNEAFSGCTKLDCFKLGNSVPLIALSAFLGCPFVAEYKRKGVCQHCGGKFKGLFTKTCEKCGLYKDY